MEETAHARDLWERPVPNRLVEAARIKEESAHVLDLWERPV